MSNDEKLMKQALEALRFGLHVGFDESSESQIKKSGKAFDQHSKAITALRERLAQPAQHQEPVAIVEVVVPHLESIVVKHILDAPFPKVGDFFYTAPPQRKPLTENELFKLWVSVPAETEDRFAFARAIEAAHGIKGEA